MKSVYLAGPIFQTDDPRSWRAHATMLLPKGWKAINPLDLELDIKFPSKLVEVDLAAIESCDAVLVRAENASWGTAMEVFYAYRLDIPVLAWPCFLDRSPWLSAHVTDFYSTLKEAVQGLENV